jgi:hypothetical protein
VWCFLYAGELALQVANRVVLPHHPSQSVSTTPPPTFSFSSLLVLGHALAVDKTCSSVFTSVYFLHNVTLYEMVLLSVRMVHRVQCTAECTCYHGSLVARVRTTGTYTRTMLCQSFVKDVTSKNCTRHYTCTALSTLLNFSTHTWCSVRMSALFNQKVVTQHNHTKYMSGSTYACTDTVVTKHKAHTNTYMYT